MINIGTLRNTISVSQQFLLGGGASIFSPTDIAGLTAWWDFSDPTTLFVDAGSTQVSVDGDAIYQANDKSWGGINLTQSTSANRPLYKTLIKNSLSCALFDGSNDDLQKASLLASNLVGTNTVTVFVVQYQAGSKAQSTTCYLDLPDSTNHFKLHATYDNVVYFDLGDAVGGGRISVAQPGGWDDAFHLVECWRNAANGEIFVDGSSELSDTFSDNLDNTQTNTLHVGGGTFKDYIAEVLIWSVALSSIDRSAVRSYLNSKWSIY